MGWRGINLFKKGGGRAGAEEFWERTGLVVGGGGGGGGGRGGGGGGGWREKWRMCKSGLACPQTQTRDSSGA